MVDLKERALTSMTVSCQVAGQPLTSSQKKLIEGVLNTLLKLYPMTEREILEAVKRGEFTEGTAAFWLGIDWLELRQRGHELKKGGEK